MADDKDARRAEALARLLVLDTPEEQAFDDIVFIASQTCDAPIALISLLDTDRQWFKARIGLDVSETPIHQSVCRLDIDDPGVLEVADLTAGSCQFNADASRQAGAGLLRANLS